MEQGPFKEIDVQSNFNLSPTRQYIIDDFKTNYYSVGVLREVPKTVKLRSWDAAFPRPHYDYNDFYYVGDTLLPYTIRDIRVSTIITLAEDNVGVDFAARKIRQKKTQDVAINVYYGATETALGAAQQSSPINEQTQLVDKNTTFYKMVYHIYNNIPRGSRTPLLLDMYFNKTENYLLVYTNIADPVSPTELLALRLLLIPVVISSEDLMMEELTYINLMTKYLLGKSDVSVPKEALRVLSETKRYSDYLNGYQAKLIAVRLTDMKDRSFTQRIEDLDKAANKSLNDYQSYLAQLTDAKMKKLYLETSLDLEKITSELAIQLNSKYVNSVKLMDSAVMLIDLQSCIEIWDESIKDIYLKRYQRNDLDLWEAVFNDQTYKIKSRGMFRFYLNSMMNLRRSDYESSILYTKEMDYFIQNPLPTKQGFALLNPHYSANCLGDNATHLIKATENIDIVGFIGAALASLKSLNFADTFLITKLIDYIREYPDMKLLVRRDGTELSYAQAIHELRKPKPQEVEQDED